MRKRAAKGQGTVFKKDGGYQCKHWVVIEGVKVRRTFDLGTTSESVAVAKNKDLVRRLKAGEIPGCEETRAAETFDQAAARICADLENRGQSTIDVRRSRLRRWASPVLGALPVTAIKAIHVREALERCAADGKAKGTVNLFRRDLGVIFGSLYRDELIPESPTKKVTLPYGLPEDTRPRQILTDDEVNLFVTCEGIPWRFRLMALVSRCLGGMRASDLRAWQWEHIDLRNWKTARVKRPKTRTLQIVALPEVLIAPLREWHTAHGSPTLGPVFELGTGSFARDLRVYLRRAFGIDHKVSGLTGGFRWVQTRQPTDREREVLENCEISKRVDFHSFRRAYVTALGDCAVNPQLAMRLSGHKDIGTHLDYVSQLRAVEAPAAAIPQIRLVPNSGPIAKKSA